MRPQVLILDGHDSHNFVELIQLALDNNIEIVELPAHTSHWLQPCDRTVFKPLKDAYADECQKLMNNYPGVMISKANFCGLLSRAWDRALTEDNIKAGFKACGIYPLNPDQIPSEAYMPNTLYSVEKDEFQKSTNSVSSGHSALVADGEESEVLVAGDHSAAGEGNSVSNVIQIEAEVHAVAQLADEPQDGATGIERPCSLRMALHAVESSFCGPQLDRYKAAYESGNDSQLACDRLYLTWKGLKDAVGEEDRVTSMNVSVTSVDSIVLESAMALQADDEFQASVTVDDIEKLLGSKQQYSEYLRPAG